MIQTTSVKVVNNTCGDHGGKNNNGSPCGIKIALDANGRCRYHPVIGATVPALSGITVPALSGAAVPALSGAAVPALSGAAVPALSGITVPALSGATVPALSGAAVPALSGATVPALSGATVPATHVTMSVPASQAPGPVVSEKNICTSLTKGGKGPRCSKVAVDGNIYCTQHLKMVLSGMSSMSGMSGVSGMPSMSGVSGVSGMPVMPPPAVHYVPSMSLPCGEVSSGTTKPAVSNISHLADHVSKLTISKKDPVKYFQPGVIRNKVWECIGTMKTGTGCDYYATTGARCGRNLLAFRNINCKSQICTMPYCDEILHSEQSDAEKNARKAVGAIKADIAWQSVDSLLPTP